jgi:LacI family transcriptional regulator
MFNSRVDGLLVSLAYDCENTDHFDDFFNKQIPIIFFDRVPEREDCTVILIDNKKAAYEATRHLLEKGCKNIIHFTAPENRSVYRDRLEGYKKALADSEIPFKEEYVIVSNLSQEAGANAAETIKTMKSLPDAVFAANDITAIGCMLALKKEGFHIPEDIAFVGFNNDPVSNVVEPNLTTINYAGYEMGCIAAQNLINHLNGISIIKTTNIIIIRSELMIRDSSRKKPL